MPTPEVASNTIPGPLAVPVLSPLVNGLRFLRDPVPYMLRLRQEYGDIAGLTRGNSKYLFVFSPALVAEVLKNKDLFRSMDLDGFKTWIPRDSAQARLFSGLSFMNGDRHTQQRRLIMPAFRQSAVTSYRDDMVQMVEEHIASWRPGETRSLAGEMRAITNRIAVKTILGMDPDTEGEELSLLLEEWMRAAFSRTTVIQVKIPGTPFYRMLELAERIEPMLKELIDRRRRSGQRGRDALSLLLDARDEEDGRLTDDELVAQTLGLYLGGHLTSSHALTWILVLLHQSPAAMRDLMAELDGELGDDAPTVEELERLPLLEGAIKEGLRLLPPTSWLLRIVAEDCQVGGYSLAARDKVIISPAVTQRIPERFPQPNRFLPERWADVKPGAFEFLPFSGGPRRCVGHQYAMLEMSLALAIILRRFRFELLPGMRLNRGRKPLAYVESPLSVVIHEQDRHFTKTPIRGDLSDLVDL